eukprot:COSAG04_NODE_1860_length_5374_cov_3.470142_2_plen_124_part_00
MDNSTYAFGLSDKVRARVEDKGRVDLNDGEMRLLDRTKQVHVATILAFLLVGVALQGSASVAVTMAGNLLGMFGILVGGWAETCGPGEPLQGKGARGVAVVTARFGLGFATAYFIFRSLARHG